MNNLLWKLKLERGKKADLPSVMALIKELAEFEKALNEVSVTLRELEDGFEQHPYYWFIVAENMGSYWSFFLFYSLFDLEGTFYF